MELKDNQLKEIRDNLVLWIKEMMQETGGSKAILGISGGKDSSIVAALCAQALGKENVLGVLMPDGVQGDISYSHGICEFLGIDCIHIPINTITDEFFKLIEKGSREVIPDLSRNTKINLPPRVRMTILYGISQSLEGSRVINTGNLSEKWIGYTTVYGDNTGAFAPLANLTSDEVIQLGRYINIPEKYIIKPPADGLTGKTDEDVLGFSYRVLNRYIREGIIDDNKVKEKIDKMHQNSRFKFNVTPTFPVDLPIKSQQE